MKFFLVIYGRFCRENCGE